MSPKYLPRILTALAAAALAPHVHAQPDLPTPGMAPRRGLGAAPLSPEQQARAAEEAPGGARNPLITWNGRDQTARQIFEALDGQIPQKILLGEGLPGDERKFAFTLAPMPLFDFLSRVCNAAGLTWGLLDRDTIVVLRARRPRPNLFELAPNGTTPRFRVLPQLPGTTPLPPGLRVLPIPRDADPFTLPNATPRAIPEGSRPFEFNGQQVYIVPLQAVPAALPDDTPQPLAVRITPPAEPER